MFGNRWVRVPRRGSEGHSQLILNLFPLFPCTCELGVSYAIPHELPLSWFQISVPLGLRRKPMPFLNQWLHLTPPCRPDSSSRDCKHICEPLFSHSGLPVFLATGSLCALVPAGTRGLPICSFPHSLTVSVFPHGSRIFLLFPQTCASACEYLSRVKKKIANFSRGGKKCTPCSAVLLPFVFEINLWNKCLFPKRFN